MSTVITTALSYDGFKVWLEDDHGNPLQIWSPSIDSRRQVSGTVRLPATQSYHVYWKNKEFGAKLTSVNTFCEVVRPVRKHPQQPWPVTAACFMSENVPSTQIKCSTKGRVRWPPRKDIDIWLRKRGSSDKVELRLWSLVQPPTQEEITNLEVQQHCRAGLPRLRLNGDTALIFRFNLEPDTSSREEIDVNSESELTELDSIELDGNIVESRGDENLSRVTSSSRPSAPIEAWANSVCVETPPNTSGSSSSKLKRKRSQSKDEESDSDSGGELIKEHTLLKGQLEEIETTKRIKRDEEHALRERFRRTIKANKVKLERERRALHKREERYERLKSILAQEFED
ncbi:hypothetical protein MIND_00999900 [Mycena indigotica]|uniref:Uncharacterized protein n=1 Tax=Mycena indigotica TaxID=2126181 RepID=A0A8H6VY90_9AGAR|nr:uncharacterized protein MIND_00999900 [Mycena indigotica]KAF7294633.1 hypothetical protein MIND_00999900 [Mycena indigotica]